MAYAFVLIVGFVSGAMSGIIGAGSSIMLLPAMAFQFGPKQAVLVLPARVVDIALGGFFLAMIPIRRSA